MHHLLELPKIHFNNVIIYLSEYRAKGILGIKFMKIWIKPYLESAFSRIVTFFLFYRTVGDYLEQQGRTIQELEIQVKELGLSVDGFYRQSILDLFKLLQPFTLTNTKPIRIGREGGGSYFLIPDFSEQDCVFSIGIGDETSFDDHIVGSIGNLVMIDHTIPNFIPSHPSMKMIHKKFSNNQNDLEINFSFLFKNYLHQDYILKMDIEGEEWSILDKATTQQLVNFRQIVIEFHNLTRFSTISERSQALKVIEKINLTHTPFFIHANNNGSFRTFGNVVIPEVIEVSFARKRDYEFGVKQFSFSDMDLVQNSKTREPIEVNWLDALYSMPTT